MLFMLEHTDLVFAQLFFVVALGLSTGFAADWIKSA